MKIERILYLIVILVLSFFLLISSCKKESEAMEEILPPIINVSDTIYICDTLFEEKPIYNDTIILDTIYVDSSKNVALPLIQKYYAQKNEYELWISGVEPLNLDSFNIFKKQEVITKTIEREVNVYKSKGNIALGGGLFATQETLLPYVSISTTTPKKMQYTLNFAKAKESYFIGFDVKIKLFDYE